jgi:DNA-binding CsgD family transcriptional regulator
MTRMAVVADLERAYAKLGIRGRDELPAALAVNRT